METVSLIDRIKWWCGRKLGFYIEASIKLRPEEVAPLLENNYQLQTLSMAMNACTTLEMKEEYREKLHYAYVRNHGLLDELYIRHGGPQLTRHLNRPKAPSVTFYTDTLLIPLVEDLVDGTRIKKGKEK